MSGAITNDDYKDMAVLRWLQTHSGEGSLEVLLSHYNELARRFLMEGKWAAGKHLLTIFETRLHPTARQKFRFVQTQARLAQTENSAMIAYERERERIIRLCCVLE